MKLVSWNVNGIRACLKKGFLDYFEEVNADIFCIQETKCQREQVQLKVDGYFQFWNDAVKKGYSGTAVFCKQKPISVQYGLGELIEDNEGRVITLEFEHFILVNVYTPNAKRDLTRLGYRLEWEDRFRDYLLMLDAKKPVVICGDMNVAHQELDLKNSKSNKGNSGFTNEEREKMTNLLQSGFIDTFRYFFPTRELSYTWWSYMNKVRERNIGWRIDYFLVSKLLEDKLLKAEIHSERLGSDHCPILLEISL
ncbi:exodeoxyribonuclease III [Halalkalibacter krulwichiae]|uniref:Exodeoxyribonuclease n=1 Tax=Halalkalibacter krulwichiae TaxID=199441 RepID=A0A1X9MB04_9BACI|nr:exodeoxyribonuclease III [Halalkalibacter krulwichiae]ARK30629.1 Exodeoxyribonuclease [Halalkalibacter krulwichiae]